METDGQLAELHGLSRAPWRPLRGHTRTRLAAIMSGRVEALVPQVHASLYA